MGYSFQRGKVAGEELELGAVSGAGLNFSCTFWIRVSPSVVPLQGL